MNALGGDLKKFGALKYGEKLKKSSFKKLNWLRFAWDLAYDVA